MPDVKKLVSTTFDEDITLAQFPATSDDETKPQWVILVKKTFPIIRN